MSLKVVAWTVPAAVVAAGLVVLAWTWSINFAGCAVEELTEGAKLAIAELTDTVKWTLTLSVGLIGLFGSLALGLKEGPQLTPAAWLLLVAAMCCFAFAAYFALMWRTGVAEALLNGCPGMITSSRLKTRFDMMTYMFLAGLGILAFILCHITFARAWRSQ